MARLRYGGRLHRQHARQPLSATDRGRQCVTLTSFERDRRARPGCAICFVAAGLASHLHRANMSAQGGASPGELGLPPSKKGKFQGGDDSRSRQEEDVRKSAVQETGGVHATATPVGDAPARPAKERHLPQGGEPGNKKAKHDGGDADPPTEQGLAMEGVQPTTATDAPGAAGGGAADTGEAFAPEQVSTTAHGASPATTAPMGTQPHSVASASQPAESAAMDAEVDLQRVRIGELEEAIRQARSRIATLENLIFNEKDATERAQLREDKRLLYNNMAQLDARMTMLLVAEKDLRDEKKVLREKLDAAPRGMFRGGCVGVGHGSLALCRVTGKERARRGH